MHLKTIAMKKQDIIDAYCLIRKIDNTIPDEVLDFMKTSTIEKLDDIEKAVLPKDIDGKQLELGHIVIVRYVWNTYVGQIKREGLCPTGAIRHAFLSPHAIQSTATYQVISHIDMNHRDYNAEASNWYYSEKGECPVEIKLWDKSKTVKQP
jgi:hypothetical protein